MMLINGNKIPGKILPYVPAFRLESLVLGDEVYLNEFGQIVRWRNEVDKMDLIIGKVRKTIPGHPERIMVKCDGKEMIFERALIKTYPFGKGK